MTRISPSLGHVWWDMLFGTYENPQRLESTCGFDDAREQRLIAMLRFNDVHLNGYTRHLQGLRESLIGRNASGKCVMAKRQPVQKSWRTS